MGELIPSALGLALLWLRSRLGLSKRKLSTLVGIHEVALGRYEKKVSREKLEEILQPLGVPSRADRHPRLRP